ncbi:MAG: site-specific DNA-methyltransferase [Succinivibrionaceae bacterium]|nr:site-specific DNA-methyltransferase [Succinivibrionaceae bacterium]MBQ8708168.1 site-specific DNA-methyltransferase [Succinivibrionaceae bacterium]
MKLYAKRGMKILDTHAGSASSLVACHRAGIDAWGYEIDPEYYRMAMERLERECAQVGLYSLEAQQPGAGLDQVGIFDLMGG